MIKSLEELDAMPPRAVIIDARNDAYQKDVRLDFWWAIGGDIWWPAALIEQGPLKVIWTPEVAA